MKTVVSGYQEVSGRDVVDVGERTGVGHPNGPSDKKEVLPEVVTIASPHFQSPTL